MTSCRGKTVVAFALLAACSNRSPAKSTDGSRTSARQTAEIEPPATVAPTIVTDRTEYRATVDMTLTRLTVPFRYTNAGPDTTFIPFCKSPQPPMLQRWDGSNWTMVYNPYHPLCAAPPVGVAPGASVIDTLHMIAARPGGNFRPVFESMFVPGYYRLLGMLGRREGTLPFEKRVSNVFRVVW